MPDHGAEAPILIMTLRRTGATALMNLIDAISPFRTAGHEPFNPDREFGYVSNAFLRNGLKGQMAEQIRNILAARNNIKHCVEVPPPRLNGVLADEAFKAGYRILFWQRTDTFSRLVSLFLAEATGLWQNEGRSALASEVRSGGRRVGPISPAAFRHQAESDARDWNSIVYHVRTQGLPVQYGTYEDLYSSGMTTQKLADLLGRIGLYVEADNRLLHDFLRSDPERPTEIPNAIPNLAALKAIRLPIFDTFDQPARQSLLGKFATSIFRRRA